MRRLGAKLEWCTHTLLYKGILTNKRKPAPRRNMTINLEIARDFVKTSTGEIRTDAKLWHSIRSKDFSRSTRGFLYKAMHGTYKIGKWWDNIPNVGPHLSSCTFCSNQDDLIPESCCED